MRKSAHNNIHMERKQIEKAAFKCIGAPCIRDCEKCQDEQKEHCTWSYIRDGFVMGALWRVKSAWHDVSEEPERNRIYLAQLGDCAFDTFYDSKNWANFSRGVNMKRWAYIKDLIPED